MSQVGRIGWVDAAKGVAIVAVVAFHAQVFLAPIGWAAWWPRLMPMLETFRMPLFFFAAGILAAKILAQSFAQLWRVRLSLFLYLYVLWSVVRWVFFQFVPTTLGPDVSNPGSWRELATIFIWPSSSLWFIYALAIFSTYIWVTRNLPHWVPISLSALSSLAFTSGWISTGNDSWDRMGMYVFFFVGAVFARKITMQFADRLTVWRAFGAIAVYLVGVAAFVTVLGHTPGARLVVSTLGVIAGIALATLLVRAGRWFAWVNYLGTKTLPIYLVHYMPVAGIAALLATLTTPPLGASVAVPILAAIAICISLLVYAALRRVPGVFDLPKFSRRTSAKIDR